MFSRMAVREPPYSAPTYEQISTGMAWLAGSLMVSVVSSAMASVADRPGRMPITMPTNAPPSPYSRVSGSMKLSQAEPRSFNPWSIGSLAVERKWGAASRHAHEEDLLEHQPGDDRCRG